MKLRFRQNSLRLRVNRREAEGLSAGHSLSEYVHFPGDIQFGYVLENAGSPSVEVEFRANVIRVAVPAAEVQNWAKTEAIGMYFELPTNGAILKVAIEKDLECVDSPAQDRDPDAYPRSSKNCG